MMPMVDAACEGRSDRACLPSADPAAGPWGSEAPIRSRSDTVVLVDEPTEQVPPEDVAGVDCDRLLGRYER